MSSDLLNALKMVADEKSMGLDDLIATIEEAVTRAAVKRLDRENLEARFNKDEGGFELYEQMEVVESVTYPKLQIDCEEAKEIDPDAELGTMLNRPVEMEDLGRIAAQSVRQMIHKKGKEAEHIRLSQEYSSKIGEMVTGVMSRRAGDGFIFELGDAEAILPPEEQLANDRFDRGRHVKLIIVDVSQSHREPVVVVSRTHPALLRKLLELETPEIGEGIVEIVDVVRDPFGRGKVTVRSSKKEVDPVGACVGVRGGRIQPIVRELSGEKIDVIQWSDDPKKLIAAALAPAKDIKTVMINEKEKSAEVIVPDDQLSPAIGKKGVNVKLAVKLTGWELDVMNAEEYKHKKGRLGSK